MATKTPGAHQNAVALRAPLEPSKSDMFDPLQQRKPARDLRMRNRRFSLRTTSTMKLLPGLLVSVGSSIISALPRLSHKILSGLRREKSLRPWQQRTSPQKRTDLLRYLLRTTTLSQINHHAIFHRTIKSSAISRGRLRNPLLQTNTASPSQSPFFKPTFNSFRYKTLNPRSLTIQPPPLTQSTLPTQ